MKAKLIYYGTILFFVIFYTSCNESPKNVTSCDFFGEFDPVIIETSIKLNEKVEIISYKKADQFNSPIDTISLTMESDSEGYMLHSKFRVDRDYEFIFNDTIIHKISSIKSEMESHGTMTDKEFFCTIQSYVLNGIEINSNNQLVIEFDNQYKRNDLINRINKDSFIVK